LSTKKKHKTKCTLNAPSTAACECRYGAACASGCVPCDFCASAFKTKLRKTRQQKKKKKKKKKQKSENGEIRNDNKYNDISHCNNKTEKELFFFLGNKSHFDSGALRKK
jgi:hypothetical protein